MSNERTVVLLFEDDDDIVADFRKHIEPLLGTDLQLEVFPLSDPPEQGDSPYEDRVESAIRKASYLKRLTLIVTDRDLSTKSVWRGLSQAAVSAAARNLGIPVACYRKKRPDLVDDFKRRPGDGLIELEDKVKPRAKSTAILARGFADLAQRIGAPNAQLAKRAKRKEDEARALSPGVLLARVLGQPAAAAHFDTFACGDRTAIEEILRVSGQDDKKMNVASQRRLVAALGVWLADLVMKFPGVLVNTQAAASYLDIDPNVFVRRDVAKVFAPARYENRPFADDGNPLWWRHLLDDIVATEECSTGLEVCEKKGLKKLKFCPCHVDPKLHAGYYCMANEKPISAQKSSGRVKWFPPGADLARLTQITYRKVAPWIGT